MDIIDHLAGIAPSSPLAALRSLRQQARDQAQASHDALFNATEHADMSRAERFAVATFVAHLHNDAPIAAYYANSITILAPILATEAAAAQTQGPYGAYPAGPLSAENTPGLLWHTTNPAIAPRLAAALAHTHMLVFHPRDAAPAALQALIDAGWTTTGIVPSPNSSPSSPSRSASSPACACWPPRECSDMTDLTLHPAGHAVPNVFTQASLGWLPWLEPFPAEALTDRHWAGLVDASRAKSPYFTLLVRDPDILQARTKTDKDIFYNPEAGLPRAERELAAAAASRFNGCIYCASVHARFASHFSKRTDDVQSLLDHFLTADLGPRWNAIVAASIALSATPPVFGPEHVIALRDQGLDDAAILDVVNGAAFFNWANRLMLTLGEPTLPAV